MTDIISPFQQETVEGLLGRADSPLTTAAIAGRFGWQIPEARRRLKRLAADGKIVEVRKTFHGIGAGNLLGWTLPDMDKEGI